MYILYILYTILRYHSYWGGGNNKCTYFTDCMYTSPKQSLTRELSNREILNYFFQIQEEKDKYKIIFLVSRRERQM